MSTVVFPCVHVVGELASVVASGRLPQVLADVGSCFGLFISLFICSANVDVWRVLQRLHDDCAAHTWRFPPSGTIMNIHSGVTWKAGESPLTAAFNYSAASLHMHERTRPGELLMTDPVCVCVCSRLAEQQDQAAWTRALVSLQTSGPSLPKCLASG